MVVSEESTVQFGKMSWLCYVHILFPEACDGLSK